MKTEGTFFLFIFLYADSVSAAHVLAGTAVRTFVQPNTRLGSSVVAIDVFIMRQGRGSEATEAVFCLQAKKPLPSGSYERRVPKIKIIFLHQECF